MDVDKALDFVGGYKRWHLTMFTLLGVSLFMPLAWQGLIVVFIGWEPPHHCQLGEINGAAANASISIADKTGLGIPELSKCSMYVNTSSGATGAQNRTERDCDGRWTYHNEGYYTVIEEWNLVCDRGYLSELSQTCTVAVSLIAETFVSYLIDKFGRKMMHIVTHLMICALGIAVAFSNGYIMYVVLRCLIGVLVVANLGSGILLCMELFDSKRRTFAGIGMEFQWIACYLVLALLAYFIPDWRHLQIVISAASAVWVIFFWILPESLIWLVAAGRYDESDEILEKMARWNGVPFFPGQLRLRRPSANVDARRLSRLKVKRESIFYAISPETINTELASMVVPMSVPFMNLLTDSVLRKHILISGLLWFADCIIYYGLIMSSPALGGNRFLNFCIMGFVEIPAVFLSLYTSEKFGRRMSTIVCHIAAGIPLAIVMFIPQTVGSSETSLVPLIVTLIMVSKLFISASFAIIILYCRELFPTNLRATSCGIYTSIGKIGSLIAPFAYYASKTSLKWLPNIVFGLIAIVAGISVFFLPETKGRSLPESTSDVHDLYMPLLEEPEPETEKKSRNNPLQRLSIIEDDESDSKM